MTSGKEFSDDEIEFVRNHMHSFPSVLAMQLALKFPQHNGGSRSTKAVSLLMQKIRNHQERATDKVNVPEEHPEPEKPKLDMRKVSRGRKSKIP